MFWQKLMSLVKVVRPFMLCCVRGWGQAFIQFGEFRQNFWVIININISFLLADHCFIWRLCIVAPRTWTHSTAPPWPPWEYSAVEWRYIGWPWGESVVMFYLKDEFTALMFLHVGQCIGISCCLRYIVSYRFQVAKVTLSMCQSIWLQGSKKVSYLSWQISRGPGL